MSNMSYCIFQNTLSALNQCWEAFDNNKEVSKEEYEAAKELLSTCEIIARQYTANDNLILEGVQNAVS
jgi:hypothetical protein